MEQLFYLEETFNYYFASKIYSRDTYSRAINACHDLMECRPSTLLETLLARKKVQKLVRMFGCKRASDVVNILVGRCVEVCYPAYVEYFRSISVVSYSIPKSTRTNAVSVSRLDHDCFVDGAIRDDILINIRDRVFAHYNGASMYIFLFSMGRLLVVDGYIENQDVLSVRKARNLEDRHLFLRDAIVHDEPSLKQIVQCGIEQTKNMKSMDISAVIKLFNESTPTKRIGLTLSLMSLPGYVNILNDICPNEVIYNLPRSAMLYIYKRASPSPTTELEVNYENRIKLMQCSDSIKSAALVKLHEIHFKSDESSFKARQYLESLLSIPFGIYHVDVAADLRDESVRLFMDIADRTDQTYIDVLHDIENEKKGLIDKMMAHINKHFLGIKKRIDLVQLVNRINASCVSTKKKNIRHSGLKKKNLIQRIDKTFQNTMLSGVPDVHTMANACDIDIEPFITKLSRVSTIENNIGAIQGYMENIEHHIEESVYGQSEAKRTIRQLFAKWFNGVECGHCIGFEGPPGVGKTSFAKYGIAQCFSKDGKNRPFAFIAMGGASHASFLDGHSYTYVESTYGKIVDALIRYRHMNPIIFIDEIDKISQTDQGKELFGVLTHLIDQTQNADFQDKYFNGITIDMSRVLFIFSYNDPSMIDRILLDRVNRVKFEPLSIREKIIIAEKHMIPDLLKESGMVGKVSLVKEIVRHVIMRYTNEPGVRMLKLLLEEVIGKYTRLLLLKIDVNINVTIEDIDSHFTEKCTYTPSLIEKEPQVGVSNALWANDMHEGGALQIEAMAFPSSTCFELKLTGTQGAVMQESMHVARTVSWQMMTTKERKAAYARFNTPGCIQGIHVHCPMTGQPKDGPSAGIAIAYVIYSLLTNKPVRLNVCMTGEITLNSKVSIVGKVPNKMLGGIYAGISRFVYPEENDKEARAFAASEEAVSGIELYPVACVSDAYRHIMHI